MYMLCLIGDIVNPGGHTDTTYSISSPGLSMPIVYKQAGAVDTVSIVNPKTTGVRPVRLDRGQDPLSIHRWTEKFYVIRVAESSLRSRTGLHGGGSRIL